MDDTKRQITKIAREVSKFTVRTMRADGIGAGEFDVIHAIRKNPGITQADVCRITGLDKGAVARQTANREVTGYLDRRDKPDDGRSRRLYATVKAETLINSKTLIETALYEWLLSPLPESDRAEFSRILETLYLRCKAESQADFPEMTAKMKGGEEHGNE